MMQKPVSNRGFMNYPIFWIVNCKTLVWPMPINMTLQFPMQLEQIVLQVALKFLDIWLAALASAKFSPGNKQILETNYFIK